MTVSAIDGATGVVSTDPSTITNTAEPTDDKNMFLKLLATQMTYQDPMNPMDNSAFLAQTAQFTALEKMQDVADATNQLLAAQQAFGASSMIGRTVSYSDANGNAASGVVTGVTFGSDGPTLNVNGGSLALAGVITVTDTPAASTTTTA